MGVVEVEVQVVVEVEVEVEVEAEDVDADVVTGDPSPSAHRRPVAQLKLLFQNSTLLPHRTERTSTDESSS